MGVPRLNRNRKTIMDGKMKTYYCDVDLKFGGNNFEAKNKKEYIKKVKESFKQEFNIYLTDKEIKNVQSNTKRKVQREKNRSKHSK